MTMTDTSTKIDPLGTKTLHIVASQRLAGDLFILDGHQVFTDQSESYDAFKKTAAEHPEMMHQNFSISVLNLADECDIYEYVTELILEGLEGAPAAEHNAPGSKRYRISGPEVTGHEGVYLVQDGLYRRSFGHNPEEPVESGYYDDLPADFADSEW
ncbi:hypothetical protein GCM10025867_49210 (plasmid) [Frondihabitans sucicola]|uniref:Uncharacterized protein n=1 Tax=Frondihabitans sucicola TaxID=1268041 RepID=A0ABN6Y9S8_9MICO|nr:hypothetical protein [Frondihabitans sucicola]BDZ52680.1 hypothetical protein GCM10025867_49210 [Frondihabitans sucicola]